MIAFVDVGYRDDGALAACVVAERWSDDRPYEQRVARVSHVAPYEPGRFHLRELPCILAVLRTVRASVGTIVVDGYVLLDGDRPGLGAKVHEVLRVPVVGVAKTEFRGVTSAVAVTRGESSKPLFVSAIGMDLRDAAARVREMHGPYRTPTLLRLVDHLTR
ncbi:MAG: endonuclease V [Polyangiales bacterium]